MSNFTTSTKFQAIMLSEVQSLTAKLQGELGKLESLTTRTQAKVSMGMDIDVAFGDQAQTVHMILAKRQSSIEACIRAECSDKNLDAACRNTPGVKFVAAS